MGVAAVVLGAVIATTGGGAQVYPVRWDEQQSDPQPAAPTPPALVLADGGLEFPDGSVQTTAAQGTLIGPALVPVTGQTTSYGNRDDGELERGIRWPTPRFTENNNGTVTDSLTGLIWLDDANCFGTQTWANALAKANALFDGCSDCGGTNNDCALTDGSVAEDWRLPNVRELQSLLHHGFAHPAVPNTAGTGKWAEGDAFSGVQLFNYWSSTSDATGTSYAWMVHMGHGGVSADNKDNSKRVWPVRGGQ
jgi:hypothetical protein